ncbi:hypothetical protein ACSBR2_034628 [Camellia fascicularis]
MPLGTTTINNESSSNSFESFFESWLVRQEHYLDELLHHSNSSSDSDLIDLVSRVLSHYQQYFDHKSIAARNNVFLVFSPPWFTPFERTFLWIAGFKPGLAFRIVANSAGELTADQRRRMEELATETKAAEREVAEELARVQESVAAPPILEVARREGRKDGEVREAEVVEGLRREMEAVLGKADLLRRKTAEKVVEMLSPVQGVRILAAATQLQLRIRMLGLQKEAEMRRTTSDGW